RIYAQKQTVGGASWIHVLNTDNSLYEKTLEIYNDANEEDIAISQLEIVSISAFGAGNENNPNYISNKWNEYEGEAYYRIYNVDAPGTEGLTSTNEAVGQDEIEGIKVYVKI